MGEKYQLIIYGSNQCKQVKVLLKKVQKEIPTWERILALDETQEKKTRIFVGKEGDLYKVFVLLRVNEVKQVKIDWDTPLLKETLIEDITIEEQPKGN